MIKKIFFTLFAFGIMIKLFASGALIHEKEKVVVISSEMDRLLTADWKSFGLSIPKEASDAVVVRRAYLDILGRLPASSETKEYLKSPDLKKLIDRLLDDRGFADYWSMRWSDILRIKSEFPINLWPNAVYGYNRRIHSFIFNNEPYDHFVKSLLLSEGSNFRVPEVNFYRAIYKRTPEGIAEAVALSFLGMRSNNFSDVFSSVGYKYTKEWKEEIIYEKKSPDPRIDFTEKLMSNPYFAKSAVNRVWQWIFGRGLVNEADDMRDDNPAVNPKLLDYLAAEFVKSGYDYKNLCRMIFNSALYRASSFPANNTDESLKHFAVYPMRRMDSEVLSDAIADITGEKSRFMSMIPEPFTYIPASHRTIEIEDGSINNAFLVLFGRPSRDNGFVSERSNRISTKQRLYLFNSNDIYNRLKKVLKNDELKKLSFEKQVEELYLIFLSRYPSEEESGILKKYNDSASNGKDRSALMQEICWSLLNTEEFIYLH